MQATLDATSLKTLTKALTCISKYGEELVINATQDYLSFSTTNSSKSAYCRFKYNKQFFSRYMMTSPSPPDDLSQSGDTSFKGQVLTKALLSILRHRTVEKSVERCVLSIVEGGQDGGDDDDERDTLESKLILRLHCKHGVIKTHRLLLSNPTSLLVPSLLDGTNESRLTIGPKTLRDLLEHFPVAKGAKSDHLLVWTFDDTEITLRSMESSIDSRGRGQLTTEISLSTNEFDLYDPYETPMTVAFHIREFTAAIAFADSMSYPLDMRLKNSYYPLVLDIEEDSVEILFVIGTSQAFGSANPQRSQSVQTKKREREASEHETPRMKRPMKAALAVPQDTVNDRSGSSSRSGSRIPGSMPPPSIIPNRAGYSQPSHSYNDYNQASSSKQHIPPPAHSTKSEPLFLPSSQMSRADEEVLRSTGLGIESMTMDELNDLLEGEGEEVDFSYMSQQPQNTQGNPNADMEVDGPDSFELEGVLSATQTSEDSNRTFQPLFED